MDEALTVEVLAVHDLGRELAARRDVSAREWVRYREWRGEVLAFAALELEAAYVACSCC